MRRFLSVSLLATMVASSASTSIAQQPAGGQGQGQPQQLVIKDQAEYQAYTSAVGQSDPKAKAQALEAFLQQYPNTVVKKEALDQLLAAYQATGQQDKLLDVANRILQVDPENEQAAIVVAYVKSTQAQQAAAQPGANQQTVAAQYQEAAAAAQKALAGLDKLQKPANVDEAQFQQQKTQIATVMNATIGLANYLSGNYQAAVQPLFNAVQANPQDVADMEYLGISLAKPVTRAQMYQDPQLQQQLKEGVFWLSKAAAMAPGQAKQQFNSVATYYYNRYHGSTEGFDQVVQQAASLPNPSNFNVAAAPSPAEQAKQVLASTPPDQILTQDGFDTWASILTVAAPADAEKVWDATKGKKLELAGTVINATNNQIQLAVSDSAIAEKRADVTVQLAKPMTTPPAVGTENYPVVGIANAYNAQPTFQLTLTDGASNVKAPAKKTTTKKTATKKRTTRR